MWQPVPCWQILGQCGSHCFPKFFTSPQRIIFIWWVTNEEFLLTVNLGRILHCLLHTARPRGWLLMIWAIPIYTYQWLKIPVCTTLTVLYFSTLQANNSIVFHMFRTTNIKQVIKLHKQTGFSQQQINTSPRLVFVEFDKPPTLLPPHSCYVCPQPSSSFIPTLLHPVSKGRHSLLINCWNSASSLVHGIEMGMEL